MASEWPKDREIKILHLEDADLDSRVVRRVLDGSDILFQIFRVENEEDYRKAIVDYEPDLVIADNSIFNFDATQAFAALREVCPTTPFMLVSGTVGEERAVALLKSGVNDYVLKQNLVKLPEAVKRVMFEEQERERLIQFEADLKRSVERFEQLADSMPQIVWAAGPDGVIDYMNKRWYEFSTMGQDIDWNALLHPDDVDAARRRYDEAMTTGTLFEIECRLLDAAKNVYRWHLCRANPVHDDEGNIVRWYGTATDINAHKKAEDDLRNNAYYDQLTSLPNRALFENRLAQGLKSLDRDEAKMVAVLFIDIDRFKLINDSLGHGVGDKLLIALARRLESLVRPGDTTSRFGGDEFVVLLEGLDTADQALRVSERIIENLNQVAFSLNESYEQIVTVSIGIAISNNPQDAPESLIRDADTAMYRAKMQGRGRYALFGEEMHTRSLEIHEIERDLRKALTREELILWYQPIIDLKTARIMGCEALVRWNHPRRGLLYPGNFISIAEETGLIVKLGTWVLQRACGQVQRWYERGLQPIDLAVNISVRQLNHGSVGINTIKSIIADTGVDPRGLKLELTESLLMDSSESVTQALKEIKTLGVQLSIDDFGTGYSSLAYLKRLPCTSLKIDQSFVRGLTKNREDEAIAAAIISMAHNLHLKVIAEGIETTDQLEFLKAIGCDAGQGYLFSPAVLPEEFFEMMLLQQASDP